MHASVRADKQTEMAMHMLKQSACLMLMSHDADSAYIVVYNLDSWLNALFSILLLFSLLIMREKKHV